MNGQMSEADFREKEAARAQAVAEVKRHVLGELYTARAMIEEALAAPASGVTIESLPEGAAFVPQTNPLAVVWDALGRLTYLLGLSDEEARFVADAAEKAHQPGAAYEPLMVFADWLDDAMRTTEAGAIRRLVPESGDVLVMTHPRSNPIDELRKVALQTLEAVQEQLGKFGREVGGVVLTEGWDLSLLDDDFLNSAKLVRRDVHLRAQEDKRRRIALLQKENAEMRQRCKDLQAHLGEAERRADLAADR